MLAYLLARAGVDVLVLEKHADFLRDFRVIRFTPLLSSSCTSCVCLEEFLQRPHDEVRQSMADRRITLAPGEFHESPSHCKFITFMPQWDFLSFLAEQARRYPSLAC